MASTRRLRSPYRSQLIARKQRRRDPQTRLVGRLEEKFVERTLSKTATGEGAKEAGLEGRLVGWLSLLPSLDRSRISDRIIS